MKIHKQAPRRIESPISDRFIETHNGKEIIRIGFTKQRISPHSGLSVFTSFLAYHDLKAKLETWLPKRKSNNATPAEDMALGFCLGTLEGANKLAHMEYVRADLALPSFLGIEKIASQSAYSRYFASFTNPYQNTACFDEMWRWCLERLASRPGGYTLDLDTTRLLHENALGKEGVRTGYTPKGTKRCLHPILGMIAEANLVAGFWLRPGNTRCDNNAVAFTQAILSRLPSHIRIGLVRADSGFFDEQWLGFLEQNRLNYIVVGRLYHPMRHLIRSTTRWQDTELAGTQIAEEIFQGWGWGRERRVILIRHKKSTRPDSGGKLLLDCPGYSYQVLVTSLPETITGLEVWRRYNGRAGCENIIKELDASFGLPQTCLEGFYATEAAMSLQVFTYNLCILFQRHLGWSDRVTAATLRFRLFTTGGIISTTGGYKTMRLSVRPGPIREWWERLLEKVVCPIRNCIAVDQTPPRLGLFPCE